MWAVLSQKAQKSTEKHRQKHRESHNAHGNLRKAQVYQQSTGFAVSQFLGWGQHTWAALASPEPQSNQSTATKSHPAQKSQPMHSSLTQSGVQ